MHTQMSRRLFVTTGLSLPLMGFSTAESLFAPKANALPGWDAFTKGSIRRVDHSPWSDLLAKHVRLDSAGIARVDYGGFSGADKAALARYIDSLGKTDLVALDKPEQYALWINLYNAAVVNTVLSAYPLKSVQEIDTSSGLFSSGPWKAKAVSVRGKALSLDDIEHGIIRPHWKDARVHYALNCAAVGCPNLRAEAYDARRINVQLDEQARIYVNHSRGVTFDPSGGLVVSKIYAWFCDDFGGTDGAVIRHLQRYAAPELENRLGPIKGIADVRYDWALNAV
jgi:hypothetical protein